MLHFFKQDNDINWIKTLDGKYLRINDDYSIEFTNEETYLKVMIGKEFILDGEVVSYPGRIVISNLDETVYLNFYGAESITLKLDKNSKIKLTGDLYVTSFGFDGGVSNIDLNGYKLYVNGKVYSK